MDFLYDTKEVREKICKSFYFVSTSAQEEISVNLRKIYSEQYCESLFPTTMLKDKVRKNSCGSIETCLKHKNWKVITFGKNKWILRGNKSVPDNCDHDKKSKKKLFKYSNHMLAKLRWTIT